MTKRKLHELYWMKKNIEHLEERLAELEEAAAKTTTRVTAGASSGGGDQDKLGNMVSNIVELQNQINYELSKMYAAEQEIESAITSLPAREAYLIRLRYIQAMTWEEICVKMHYGWAQIHRMHSEALKMLA